MPRQYRIAARLSQAGEAVLDVPTHALLQQFTPEQLLQDFERQWGVRPTTVALPVVEPDGLLFDVEGLADTRRSTFGSASADGSSFADAVLAFADHGLDVTLSALAFLSFFNSQELLVENVVGDSAQALCLGNPRSREIVAAIVGTGIDIAEQALRGKQLKITGVALDITDLWGMSGRAGRIEPTCFCRHCTGYIDEMAPDLTKTFRTFPNAFSLALSATSTGIKSTNTFGPQATPDDVIGLAKLSGFDDVFGGASYALLETQAASLLRYARVRHDQTVAGIDDIFNQAFDGLDPKPKRILMIEGAQYIWTSGLWLSDLDAPADRTALVPCDELWLDTAAVGTELKRIPYRSYMWKRSRYFISSFLDSCASACDPVTRSSTGYGRYTIQQMRQNLNQRFSHVVGSGLRGQSSLLGLPELRDNVTKSERVGFVGVALPEEFGERFISRLDIAPGLGDLLEQEGDDPARRMADLIETLGLARGEQTVDLEE